MKAKERISESTHYEAYFDLWGFSFPWIISICDALHDFCEPSLGDEGESYRCEACMAFRFTSTDKSRVEQAKAIFAKLEPLARRTVKGKLEEIYYHP